MNIESGDQINQEAQTSFNVPPNRQSSVNIANNGKDYPLKFPITRVLFDMAVLALASLGFEAIFRFFGAYRRGFFCDDESIRMPYQSYSTVSFWMLMEFCFGITALTFFCVELFRLKKSNDEQFLSLETGRDPATRLFIRFVYLYGYFFVALVATHLFTSVAKFSVGRLRPHFMNVCVPNLPNLTTNCGKGPHEYITDYNCSGNPDLVAEARLSFFSGHSSLSMCSAVFVVIYLQSRLLGQVSSRAFVPLLQIFVICLAMFIAYSRIFDYMHHWSDVMCGMILGGFVAFIVITNLTKLKFPKFNNESISELMTIVETRNISTSGSNLNNYASIETNETPASTNNGYNFI